MMQRYEKKSISYYNMKKKQIMFWMFNKKNIPLPRKVYRNVYEESHRKYLKMVLLA